MDAMDERGSNAGLIGKIRSIRPNPRSYFCGSEDAHQRFSKSVPTSGRTYGNKKRAAEILRLDRKTLYRKLDEYRAAGIEVEA